MPRVVARLGAMKGVVLEGEIGEAAAVTPLWKNRDYRLLWGAQIVSIIGTQVSQIAFPLLVLTLTGSPARAGFVSAARALPYLLFALPAGALVDRWNRKLTMIFCGAGSAIALTSIAVAYALATITIEHVLLVSFVEGTFAVFFGLAETAALPHVVPKSQLPAAIAQNNMQYAVGSVVGPSLGGAMFASSPLLPFLADAASYAAASFSLVAMRVRLQRSQVEVRRSLRAEIAEGVQWLWRKPLLRFMAFLMGSLNFTAGYPLVVIVIAQHQGASPALTGAVFAAGGIGGILGAVVAPRIQRRCTFGQAIIGMAWYFALSYLLLVVAATPALLMFVFAVDGLMTPIYDTVQASYRLALIPDQLQGRVNSVFQLVARGIQPLGLAVTGMLLERSGIVPTCLVLTAWLVVMATVTTVNGHVRHAPALTGAGV